ncbi:hypothetical protein QCI44_16865 [Bacillus cereus group sp. RP37]|nr:hypothetical protein KQ1_02214 [Bacillus cereus BAG3O-1]HDR6299378.1 hypothetical protein [Bacillus cereus]HDR6302296.1 hypothetical protein [Bacillus cereus]HDR8172289.1 hypothetical protein [Bacillus thuringiensis]HDX9668530.1 hypothetical protein [Bacillus cereus]
MKKRLLFLLCIILIITGCNSSNNENRQEYHILKLSIATFKKAMVD